MIWDQLTYPQIEQLDKNIPVILPIAATEQHGAHLPLSTDRLIGEHFVQSLHRAIPEKILVMPTVGIGCSTHHMDFPGTLTLSHETFERQVIEIIDSIIHHGFNDIILFNSHGGNQAIGQVLIEKLGHKYKSNSFTLITWWNIAVQELKKITESGLGGTGHACEFETSLMMHIAPNLVQNDKIQKGANQPTFVWAEGDMLNGPKASFFRNTKSMTPNGIFGNPEMASEEKGKQIIKVVHKALLQIIKDLYNLKN